MDQDNGIVTFDDVVRIMMSYDMGWTTRGSGRSYDGLDGFGALTGVMSGLVLDYGTCNRKCANCDSKIESPDHDSRRNFCGSAKAMEAHLGEKAACR